MEFCRNLKFVCNHPNVKKISCLPLTFIELCYIMTSRQEADASFLFLIYLFFLFLFVFPDKKRADLWICPLFVFSVLYEENTDLNKSMWKTFSAVPYSAVKTD